MNIFNLNGVQLPTCCNISFYNYLQIFTLLPHDRIHKYNLTAQSASAYDGVTYDDVRIYFHRNKIFF